MEHFEEYHVVDLRGQPYPRTCLVPPTSPEFDIPHSAQDSRLHQQPQPQLQRQHHQHPHQQGPLDPDDLKLGMGSTFASSSAPFTPRTTPLEPRSQRAFANTSSSTHSSLSRPSSECLSPISAYHTATVLPSTSVMSACSRTQHDPFSSYSTYSSHVDSPLQASQEITSASGSHSYSCVSRTLLYSPSSIMPANTPSSSRVASPVTTDQIQASYQPLSAQPYNPTSSFHLSNTLCCPMPHCDKSYRQVNKLKYHATPSHNNNSPKDLEARQVFLAEKGVANGDSRLGAQTVEGELHESERETKRRPRPFACGVGDCQRQYKDMNSLRTSSPCQRLRPFWADPVVDT